jgi:transposase
VIAIHPNQVAAMRPRFSAAGGKSDNFDAFVLAELARTDSHRFRVLTPDSDQTKALRALTRAREDLVAHRVELANELRAQLEGFWPEQEIAGPGGLLAQLTKLLDPPGGDERDATPSGEPWIGPRASTASWRFSGAS